MLKCFAIFALAAAIPVCLADSAAGINWTPPASWKSLASRPMRAATYAVPAAPGDKEDGECAVYYFGPGQGGSVEANLERWTKQFEQTDGKPTSHPAQVKKRTIHGIAVTTVDVSGAYSGMGGPMAASKSVKPGYRLLGAIAEAPEGAVFFKFTGPAKTVTANQANFEALVGSLKNGSK
ncbi:MAG: hypothetical protein M3Y27_10905 [Acidobacteriota bacterium]|nr:hypothetical protein [Acidobacteriota bacterium]